MLSPRLLQTLRVYWKARRPRLPYLFPGRTGDKPITRAAVHQAVRKASAAAGTPQGDPIRCRLRREDQVSSPSTSRLTSCATPLRPARASQRPYSAADRTRTPRRDRAVDRVDGADIATRAERRKAHVAATRPSTHGGRSDAMSGLRWQPGAPATGAPNRRAAAQTQYVMTSKPAHCTVWTWPAVVAALSDYDQPSNRHSESVAPGSNFPLKSLRHRQLARNSPRPGCRQSRIPQNRDPEPKLIPPRSP